jgi:hypothetical protein
MPTYLSPGVYVEEIPSAVQAIAGVGTSTAGFIGIFNATYVVPKPNPHRNAMLGADQIVTVNLTFPPANKPQNVREAAFTTAAMSLVGATLENGTAPIKDLAEASTTLQGLVDAAPGIGATESLSLPVRLKNTGFLSPQHTIKPENINEPKLCTNFGDFRKFFGDFSDDQAQNRLAHAVYGFFHNGGTRCFVGVAPSADLGKLLERFAAVDEVALVAAPGLPDAMFAKTILAGIQSAIVTHCKITTQDRFAIFDTSEAVIDNNGDLDLTKLSPSTDGSDILPDNSDYASLYFPWIEVFDPAKKIKNPVVEETGRIMVPPSGHIAGVYARVDTNRGVHKAPANEPVMGALGIKYNISKAQQDGLNPQGVNCIRDLNGNIRVWGARTIGGDANGEWRYVNVRRTFLFLRESIDQGTQWAVFEPNDEKLWAKITRNLTAFLTTVWRSGALFGSTAEQAFYVKCDAETNPPELREVGQVVTEIGVAVVRPAEFVIFRISQWQPEQ